MKYIVNLTHKTTGKGKVRKVNAETMESAHTMMAKRYPEYDVGRIYADADASVSMLYQIMKEAKREAE
jgi:hypothetical protein|tara:strand:- start:1004 stop:1207 length:204 start_codon:yes stop_codon:yes gene_type:complete